MQVSALRGGANAFADRRGGALVFSVLCTVRAGNWVDPPPRRLFAGFGADGRRAALVRADSIEIGFGADPFGSLHRQVEAQPALPRSGRDYEVLGADA